MCAKFFIWSMEWEVEVGAWWSQSIQRFEFMPFYMACNFIKLQFSSLVSNQTILFDVGYDNSWKGISDIYGCIFTTTNWWISTIVERVQAFDAYTWATFNLKTMCMWSKHDFPTYGLIIERVTKGHTKCPPCGPTTKAWSSRKLQNMLNCGSCRYLPRSHPYQRAHTTFNGEIKLKATHVWISTKDVINWVIEWKTWLQGPWNKANGKFDPIHKHGVKRFNIMFQLSYWKAIFKILSEFQHTFLSLFIWV
jgi:predicted RNA-binding Zn-ribbon protein involved in translation (DUF1610 family)